MAPPLTIDEARKKLLVASHNRKLGNVVMGALIAAEVTVEAERALGRFGSSQEQREWHAMFRMAARHTATFYEEAAHSSPARWLVAAQYHELVGSTGSSSDMQRIAMRQRDRCVERFEIALEDAKGVEREAMICEWARYVTNLPAANRVEGALAPRLDNVGAVYRHEIPPERLVNCQRMAPRVAAALLGERMTRVNTRLREVPDRAMVVTDPDEVGRGPYVRVFEAAYGERFKAADSLGEIRAQMLEAGDGTVAILRTRRPDSAHVAVVASLKGEVVVLEGQTDKVTVLRDVQDENLYSSLMVHDPRRDRELRVDEGARVENINEAILTVEFQGDVSLAKTQAAQALRTAIKDLGRDTARVPRIDAALETARCITGAAQGGAASVRSVVSDAGLRSERSIHFESKNQSRLQQKLSDAPEKLFLAVNETDSPRLVGTVDDQVFSMDVATGRTSSMLPNGHMSLVDVTGVTADLVRSRINPIENAATLSPALGITD